MKPIFLPNSFKPSPTFLSTVFIPFAAALAPSASIAITPIVIPTAVTTVATVKPCFLKRSFNRSRRGSLSTICSLSCSSCSLSCTSCGRLSVFSVTFHEHGHLQKVVHFRHLQSFCSQGHPTTVFCKIPVRRSKYCLEISIAH